MDTIMRMMDKAYIFTKIHVDNFFHDEKGEVNIVATVVLIGIAVVLAVIFRDAIKKLVEDLLKGITDNANKAVSN